MPEQDLYCVAITSCGTEDDAVRLARILLEQRLAACVQLHPIRSFYRWQGEVREDPEIALMIKTRRTLHGSLQRVLAEHHPYDVPELVLLPIGDGSPAYLDWVREQTT